MEPSAIPAQKTIAPSLKALQPMSFFRTVNLIFMADRGSLVG
jgi:hypothetical protein